MLASKNRLRHTKEFRSTVRSGTRVSRPLVLVHVASRGTVAEPPRAGFIVSSAVGGAVVRNAVRRRLRHIVRARLAGLPAGTQVVVRARSEAATAPSSALARDVDAAFDRLLREVEGSR